MSSPPSFIHPFIHTTHTHIHRVEVSGAEYTFAQNGIFFHIPKTPMVGPGQVVTLKESIPMGTHVGSANEVGMNVSVCVCVYMYFIFGSRH